MRLKPRFGSLSKLCSLVTSFDPHEALWGYQGSGPQFIDKEPETSRHPGVSYLARGMTAWEVSRTNLALFLLFSLFFF